MLNRNYKELFFVVINYWKKLIDINVVFCIFVNLKLDDIVVNKGWWILKY